MAECCGQRLHASDVGVPVPGDPVAYAAPGCPEHDPEAEPTTEDLEALAALALKAEQDVSSPRCMNGEAVFFAPYGQALMPGHIYSESGVKEFGITKVCEYHFDLWTAEADEVEVSEAPTPGGGPQVASEAPAGSAGPITTVFQVPMRRTAAEAMVRAGGTTGSAFGVNGMLYESDRDADLVEAALAVEKAVEED